MANQTNVQIAEKPASVWAQWKASNTGMCYSSFKHSLRPLIAKAQGAVYRAIRRGALRPAYEFDCVDCCAEAECYDHRDYTRPLDVSPVCRRCNNRRGAGKPYRNV